MKWLRNTLTGLAIGILAHQAAATVREVPTSFPTIQSAINAAGNGDTVLVRPGRYFENVGITGKDILLASQYILTHDVNDILATVIDGSAPLHADTGSCIRIYLAQFTTVDGLTLVNGTGTAWRDVGDNQIFREGGGVLIEGSFATVQNCVIAYNESVNVTGAVNAGGGGIRAGFTGATLRNNAIYANRAYYGAGVVIFRPGSTIVIENNLIARNTGGEAFGGGGIWTWNAINTVFMTNNTIVHNHSATSGGGLDLLNADISIRNNIVRDNTAAGSGAQFNLRGGLSGPISWCNVSASVAGSSNMINQNPLFESDNFLLGVSSPSIDAGDPNTLFNDKPDPGNPTLALFPSMGGIRNDHGAYGGPGARELPLVTNLQVAMVETTGDFGALQILSADTLTLTIQKTGFGTVRVDSVRFRFNSGSTLALLSSVTSLGPTMYDANSGPISLTWTPTLAGMLSDTVLVYHDCPNSPSPLRVPLSGEAVGCCLGVTGNLDGDPGDLTDGSDLQALVDYIFFNDDYLGDCFDENDANKDDVIDGGDLQLLVDIIFFGADFVNCY